MKICANMTLMLYKMLEFIKIYTISLKYDEICKLICSQTFYLSWPFDKTNLYLTLSTLRES